MPALHTDLLESRAKLTPGLVKVPTIAGEKLSRRWEFIDATETDTLMASVPSTITDPQADGQTYSGTFAVAQAIAQAQDDRSVIISQELTLINTITSTIGTLQALSPTKKYTNSILRPFNLDEGEGDGIRWTYKNINPANRSIAMGYSDSDLETTLGATAGAYKDRDFEINEDGTATFIIITEEHNFTNTSGSSPNKVLANTRISSLGNYDPKNDMSGVNRTKVDGGDGIPVDDMEEIRDNQVAEAGYALTGVSVTENGDGSASLRRSQTKKRATTDQFITRFSSAQGTQPESQTVVWLNLSETDADTVYNDAVSNENDMTGATPASPASHVLRYVEKPFETGVDVDGKQLFGVVRVSWIPKSSSTSFRGLRAGTKAPFKLYGVTIDNDDLGTTNSYIVIVDRIVTTTYSTARDFAAGSDVHPIDDNRLGGVEWNDSSEVYIGLKETWYGDGDLTPNNNYNSIDDSTPAR